MLTSGDLGMRAEVLKTKREIVFNYLYMAQVKKLNEMLRAIEEIEVMRND